MNRSKNEIFFLLLFSLGCLLSCDSDESSFAPGEIFKMTIPYDANKLWGENWVLAHDRDGHLIDYKRYFRDQTVTLKTQRDIEGKITITLISFSSRNHLLVYAYTFMGISQREHWTAKLAPPQERLDPADDCLVKIIDFPGMIGASVSEKGGILSAPFSGEFNESVFKDNIWISYSKPSDLFVYGYSSTDDVPRYTWLKNVETGSSLEVNYSDMNSFDDIIDVEFPEATRRITLVVNARVSENDLKSNIFTNCIIDPEEKHDHIKIGFLKGYKYNDTHLWVYDNNRSFRYWRNGDRPEKIVLPVEAKLTTSSTLFTDFSCRYNLDFTYRSSLWYYFGDDPNTGAFSRFEWNVYSPEENHKFGELPGEFGDLYPYFDADRLQYGGSSFISGNEPYPARVKDEHNFVIKKLNNAEGYAVGF